jgi:hypothetical protein
LLKKYKVMSCSDEKCCNLSTTNCKRKVYTVLYQPVSCN